VSTLPRYIMLPKDVQALWEKALAEPLSRAEALSLIKSHEQLRAIALVAREKLRAADRRPR